MLTKPEAGWTDFSIAESPVYGLSNLFDDIAFCWIEQAIRGLETMQPFSIKGYLEPDELICDVGLRSCRISICSKRNQHKVIEIMDYNVSMQQFCQMLYDDIIVDIDGWASFHPSTQSLDEKKTKLTQMLKRLRNLIGSSGFTRDNVLF